MDRVVLYVLMHVAVSIVMFFLLNQAHIISTVSYVIFSSSNDQFIKYHQFS